MSPIDADFFARSKRRVRLNNAAHPAGPGPVNILRDELRSLLEVYGTAGGGGRFLGTPQQAYLAGFG